MDHQNPFAAFSVRIFTSFLVLILPGAAQTESIDTPATDQSLSSAVIGDRGEDFAEYRRISRIPSDDGTKSFRTNSYFLLENGLYYLENEEWRMSEDIIEPSPDGAVARRGPHKAWFSSDLNSQIVFDLNSSDGKRLAGGVRSLQILDTVSGQMAVVGRVKESVRGFLVPPNTIVYPDAFDGVLADVVYLWAHNHFSQSVVLRSLPENSEGFQSAVFEVVTEFVDPPEPEFLTTIASDEAGASLPDDVLIGFGKLTLVRGAAFPVEDGSALAMGIEPSTDENIAVRKRWERIEDGRTFLVESVPLTALSEASFAIPLQDGAFIDPMKARSIHTTRVWPAAIPGGTFQRPLELAAAPYRPKGVVVDFEVKNGTSSSFTFQAGVTYHITNSFTVGPGAATFQPGCVVKYANNAYLNLLSPPSFSTSAISPVFTADTDDTFGEDIDGNPSTPVPSANPAILISYPSMETRIRNVKIRHAKTGIRYYHNGYSFKHYIDDSLFENITGTGSSAINLAYFPNTTNVLTNVRKCNVTTSFSGSGSVNGSITDASFCLDQSFKALSSGQAPDYITPPPDVMGAVGPNHIVLLVNQAIVVYNKSDGSVCPVECSDNPDNFFGASGTYDPRILYDHIRQRWIAVMASYTPGDVILAVSPANSPLNSPLPLSGWTKIPLNIPHPDPNNWTIDFPTLGYDADGIYIAVAYYDVGKVNWRYRVVAIQATSSEPSITTNKLRYFPPNIVIAECISRRTSECGVRRAGFLKEGADFAG